MPCCWGRKCSAGACLLAERLALPGCDRPLVLLVSLLARPMQLLVPNVQAQSDLTPEQAASVVALRDGLVDKKDFWAVQEVTWNLLKSW